MAINHLDIDTHAGEAWVGLRVRLGHAPIQVHQQPRERSSNGPSWQRRRDRRAHEGKELEAEEALTAVSENDNSENETDSVEEVREPAAAEVVIPNLNELSSNANAERDYFCDICETKFSSLRAV